MRRSAVILVVALASLGTFVPPAAANPVLGCALVADNGYNFGSAPTFRGVLAVIAGDEFAGPVLARCEVRVNGFTYADAQTGYWAGTAAAVGGALVTFDATSPASAGPR